MKKSCNSLYPKIFVLYAVIFITAISTFADRRQREDSKSPIPNKDTLQKTNVITIWNTIASKYKINSVNIIHVKLLLAELGVDSTILSKEDSSRLRSSLDLYLKQFAFYFNAESEKHCYWLAWLISKGINRPVPNKKDVDSIKSSYEIFFDEVVKDRNDRLLKKIGKENYTKYEKQIDESSKWIRAMLDLYYDNLHNDLLFPAFKKPLTKEVRKNALEHVRKACELPSVRKPTRLLELEEEVFVKDLEKKTQHIPNTLAYRITLKTIWKDFLKTSEWGYMHSTAVSCHHKRGRWPIDMKFSPDHDLNRAKALDEKRREKKK